MQAESRYPKEKSWSNNLEYQWFSCFLSGDWDVIKPCVLQLTSSVSVPCIWTQDSSLLNPLLQFVTQPSWNHPTPNLIYLLLRAVFTDRDDVLTQVCIELVKTYENKHSKWKLECLWYWTPLNAPYAGKQKWPNASRNPLLFSQQSYFTSSLLYLISNGNVNDMEIPAMFGLLFGCCILRPNVSLMPDSEVCLTDSRGLDVPLTWDLKSASSSPEIVKRVIEKKW